MVVLVGALLLGVPLAGSIAVVTFIGAYIPYLGAWTAGIFSVLVALGGAGTDAAIGMIVVQVLANGLLQQLIQPIAYGAALGIHPLAVLLVTIAGGSLFGAVGLILAAPVTAAATRIAADLARNREAPGEAPATAPDPGPPSRRARHLTADVLAPRRGGERTISTTRPVLDSPHMDSKVASAIAKRALLGQTDRFGRHLRARGSGCLRGAPATRARSRGFTDVLERTSTDVAMLRGDGLDRHGGGRTHPAHASARARPARCCVFLEWPLHPATRAGSHAP